MMGLTDTTREHFSDESRMQFPPVTRALLIVNVIVYLLQQGGGEAVLVDFALWPLGPHRLEQLDNGSIASVGFEPWQLITYSFLHGNFPHIAFNMFALWMFGGPVENALGARRYTLFYFVVRARRGARAAGNGGDVCAGRFRRNAGCVGWRIRVADCLRDLYPQARIVPLYLPIPIPARSPSCCTCWSSCSSV